MKKLVYQAPEWEVQLIGYCYSVADETSTDYHYGGGFGDDDGDD